MTVDIPQHEAGFLAALSDAVTRGDVQVDLVAYMRWRARHPTRRKQRAMRLRKMARKKGATVVETIHLDVLWLRDRGRCALCSESVRLFGGKDNALTIAGSRASVDHIQPLAKGGQHTYDNAQLAHVRCNQDKSDDWAG